MCRAGPTDHTDVHMTFKIIMLHSCMGYFAVASVSPQNEQYKGFYKYKSSFDAEVHNMTRNHILCVFVCSGSSDNTWLKTMDFSSKE